MSGYGPSVYGVSKPQLLARFIEYVQIGTAANPNSSEYPSSEGQWTLGKRLTQQLLDLGIVDAQQDEHGLVWGTVPANLRPVGSSVPTILLNAHMDTSPEAPGDNCKPQVIDSYDGGTIRLLNGECIDPVATAEWKALFGHTLVTTDGTTLLGGDDKAGIATIMQCVQTWMSQPELLHGPVRILFTCDEEIGHGTRHFQLAKANASFGYTLDGGGAGTIDVETFSADGATITFRGRNSHPSVAKGVMVNSLRAASMFLNQLPSDHLTPETTSDQLGFIHPYTIHGGVSETSIQLLLRDFQTDRLQQYASLLQQRADEVALAIPGIEAKVVILEQYRNMADVLRRSPQAVELAEAAHRELNTPFKRDSIRGGTDGALMSALGLPTPNLSVGQYNIHSVREFVSIDQMLQAADHVLKMAELAAR
jgi:tripeptide aminopeptidase